MIRSFAAALAVVMTVGVTGALAQPAPGEPPPPPGPVQPSPNQVPGLAPGADPNFGEIELYTDFLPDPHVVHVTAGGPLDVSAAGGECLGWISAAPTFEVFFHPGDYPLIISAIADRGDDIVLAVREPIGIWHCNDDANGSDPMVVIDTPYFGIWGIWVGTFDVSAEVPATLYVSEVVAGWDGVAFGAQEPNLDLIEQQMAFTERFGEAEAGMLELRAGFDGDPRQVTVRAGGTRTAPNGCPGFIGGQPSLFVSYEAGGYPLLITAYSAEDTVLVVNGPDMEWYCEDDVIGSDPLLRFDNPMTGVYAIWVGSFDQTNNPSQATLAVSERGDLR